MRGYWTFVLFIFGVVTSTVSCARHPDKPNAPKSIIAAQTTSATATAAPVATVVETNAEVRPAAPEPQPAPATLEERLAARAVTDQHFARRELFTWTTPDQIDKLRQTQTLLVATAKTRGAPSPYSRLLQQLAQGQGPSHDVARLLSEHPGLTKRRYAWPSPFATAVPLGERSYGHALVRIVLKEDAFFVKLDPLEHEPFAFVDLKDKPVPATEVVAHPERIAAVFHVRLKPDGGPRFREYIVCNEAMIAEWSVGTSRERAAVNTDAALVADLVQSPLVSAFKKDEQLGAAAAWSRAVDKPDLVTAWRAAIAFDSPKYKPGPRTLGAISESLAAYDATGEPLEYKPSLVFPDKL